MPPLPPLPHGFPETEDQIGQLFRLSFHKKSLLSSGKSHYEIHTDPSRGEDGKSQFKGGKTEAKEFLQKILTEDSIQKGILLNSNNL